MRAFSGLWAYRVGNAEFRASVVLAQRVANLPPNQADPNDRLTGQRMLGTALHYLADQSNARRHLEHMLSSYVAPTSQQHIDITRYHFDQLVTGCGALARILWLQGFPDQAMRMARDNVENARARDHVTSLCTALDLVCVVVLEVADLATAERYVTMLLECSAKVVLGIYQAFGHNF